MVDGSGIATARLAIKATRNTNTFFTGSTTSEKT
jgi:hypothetical protein